MKKGKYYNYYLRRIEQRLPLWRTILESGMICEIKYTPDYGVGNRQMFTYLALNLFKGKGAGPKVKIHLLRLDNLAPRVFRQLVENSGLVYSQYFRNFRRLDIEQLLIENAGKFYLKEIKPDINSGFKDTYRTFTIGLHRQIRVIKFKFHK